MSSSIQAWHIRFTQQARWTQSLREHIFQQTGALHLPRILEIGSGTGAVTRHLSDLRGNGQGLWGLDINFAYLQTAKKHTPDSRQVAGNAYQLPFANGAFDAVYCHFFLLWLDDPLSALLEMRRVVRPGGALMVFAEPDYSARIDYPAELMPLGAAQADSLRFQGASPDVGRSLRGLMNQAGLISVSAGLLGGEWQASQTPEGWETEWNVIEADLHSTLTTAQLARLKEIDQRAWQNGSRILYVPTFYAWGYSPD